jgi:hypothetical protein
MSARLAGMGGVIFSMISTNLRLAAVRNAPKRHVFQMASDDSRKPLVRVRSGGSEGRAISVTPPLAGAA